MKRFAWALSMCAAVASLAHGDTVVLNETFETYADDAAMHATWVTTNTALSRIVDTTIDPAAFPDVAAGKGVEHAGGVNNIWSGLTTANALHPSATQSVRIEADIWENASSANKRNAVGFRGPAVNIIELGSWNANTCDPTVAGCAPGTTGVGGPGFIAADGRGLAARLQLFQSFSAPLTVQPNWQYFDLPLDLDTSANGVVAVAEVGAAWNRYTATITPSSVTISIDLFRDGLKNTDNVAGTGTPGIDATKTWNVTTRAEGYSDVRFGGPSGVTSTGGSLIFDNIKVSMIDVVVAGLLGDFDQDNDVDSADYVKWQDNDVNNGGSGGALPNDNGAADQTARYNLWKANFGNPPASSAAVNLAIPEPATLVLILAAAGFIATRRRR